MLDCDVYRVIIPSSVYKVEGFIELLNVNGELILGKILYPSK